MTKITIIGTGSVGSTIAYTLTVQGMASEIVMIDINGEKANNSSSVGFNNNKQHNGAVESATNYPYSVSDFYQFNIQWRGKADGRNLAVVIDNVLVSVEGPAPAAE